MKIRMLAMGLIATLATLPALAADIDGKWNASVDTPQGAIALVFEFKADGEKLSGTISNDMMGNLPISDGAVKGNEVTFKLSIEGGPGGAITVVYKGAVKGDDLTLVSKFDAGGGEPMETTLAAKRAK
jgi:hypothetical protein